MRTARLDRPRILLHSSENQPQVTLQSDGQYDVINENHSEYSSAFFREALLDPRRMTYVRRPTTRRERWRLAEAHVKQCSSDTLLQQLQDQASISTTVDNGQ